MLDQYLCIFKLIVMQVYYKILKKIMQNLKHHATV